MSQLDNLLDILVAHEEKFSRSFSFIPSENTVSPMSRLAYFSDAISRYFFDEAEVFGRWSFEGGSIAGRIQTEILVPLMRRIGGGEYVDVRCISGLTGMTVALSAFAAAGDRILSVPVGAGGHPDTQYVARKLGYQPLDIPFLDWATIDFERLAQLVDREQPSLVYIDHATALFPLELKDVVASIRSAASKPVHIHVDTSHVNGLIWGGVLPNPLLSGADSYGGSTHKTFPGPHKAVLLTSKADVSDRLTATAVNMVSHHHLASVIALAISMIEFAECDGKEYAHQVVRNAKRFAQALDKDGFDVQGKARGYTLNHQVWIGPPTDNTAHVASSSLFECGLVVNPYDPLPSSGRAGIRMGLNEATRLGCLEGHMETLASFFTRRLLKGDRAEAIERDVAEFRRQFRAAYCFDVEAHAARWSRLVNQFNDGRAEFFSASH